MALITRRRALTGLGATLAAVLAPPAGSAFVNEQGHHPRPLWRAHAHNDYEHPRPLFDALDHRFGSVEADIFLVGDQLLIGHDATELDPSRTLESLYLEPLSALVKANHGSVYRGWRKPLQLLIDIKTEGSSTYLELDRHLQRYKHLFTTYAHGRVHPGAVTNVISGDRAARIPMEAQTVRRAFYDGLARRPRQLGARLLHLAHQRQLAGQLHLARHRHLPRRRAAEAALHRPAGARARADRTVLEHPGRGGPRP